jgi:hypothetical protein
MPDMLKLSKSLVACLLATACGTVTGSPPDTTARVRVAHVSPGAPAVDFCLARHGTTQFTGPILAGAGRAAGLSYATVTRYFDVDAARYDVRLVAPGATSCAQPLAGLDDFTRLPELTPGASATIAAEGTLGGQGDAAFTLRGYADATEVPAAMTRLRFVHASPGTPPVDVGTGTGVGFQRLFAGVAFGKVAVHPPLEDGYLQTPPLTAATLTARLSGSTIVWSPSTQRGFMRFVGLPPNDPAKTQYQLWIFDRQRDQAFPVDGGVFDVPSTGEVIVPITAKLRVGDATLFAVTVEHPGGVVVSRREHIVVTAGG